MFSKLKKFFFQEEKLAVAYIRVLEDDVDEIAARVAAKLAPVIKTEIAKIAKAAKAKAKR